MNWSGRAAVRDIINIAQRRNPGIEIILYPARVQGEGAAESVAAGLRALDQLGVDVIIAGRGGGSIEDLWAFNEEIVARAIFSCQTPVISAVGHETDTTIADFVADLRAPTPSAAAELAVMDVSGVLQMLVEKQEHMERILDWKLQECRLRMKQYSSQLQLVSPMQKVRDQRSMAEAIESELRLFMEQKLLQRKHSMQLYIEKLRAVSPLEKLAQGYACTVNENSQRVYSVNQVEPKDRLQIYVSDGRITAQVLDAEEIERDVLWIQKRN